MNLIIVFVVVAVVSSAPSPDKLEDELEEIRDAFIEILKDERKLEKDGSYAFNFETENGIFRTEAGTPTGPNGAIVSTGEIRYRMPNGEMFHLTYVADENGYQPKSEFLPVAPEFPHPIPDFVLAHIERARIEDEQAALEELKEQLKENVEEDEDEDDDK